MTPEQMDRIDRLLAEMLMEWVWSEEHNIWVLDSERDADGRLTFCCPDSLDYDEEKGEQEFWSPTRNINQALGDGGPGTVVGEICKRLNSKGFELRRGCVTGEWTALFPIESQPGLWVGDIGETKTIAICKGAMRIMKDYLGIDLEEEKDGR